MNPHVNRTWETPGKVRNNIQSRAYWTNVFIVFMFLDTMLVIPCAHPDWSLSPFGGFMIQFPTGGTPGSFGVRTKSSSVQLSEMPTLQQKDTNTISNSRWVNIHPVGNSPVLSLVRIFHQIPKMKSYPTGFPRVLIARSSEVPPYLQAFLIFLLLIHPPSFQHMREIFGNIMKHRATIDTPETRKMRLKMFSCRWTRHANKNTANCSWKSGFDQAGSNCGSWGGIMLINQYQPLDFGIEP